MTGNLQWWVCSIIPDLFEQDCPQFLFRSNQMRARMIAHKILGRGEGINLSPFKKSRKIKCTQAGQLLVNRRLVVYYRKEEDIKTCQS